MKAVAVRFAVGGGALSAGAALTIFACQGSYTLDGAAEASPTYGPTGATFEIRASSAAAGQAVSFAAMPSSISVSPSSVTVSPDGTAVSYALVPYGTEGAVIASASLSVPKNIVVAAPPLTLCTPTIIANDAGVLGALGQVYAVSVQTQVQGLCGDPDAATGPVGVPITFTTIQPSTGASTTSGSGGDSGTSPSAAATSSPPVIALTGTDGVAVAYMQLPWGASIVVQVSGGGATNYGTRTGNANPASLACLSWTEQANGIYLLQARAVAGSIPIPAATVGFSVLYPSANAATISPSSAATDEGGVASTYVAVPDAGSLPTTIEAVLGTASLLATLDGGSAGQAGTCP